MIEIGHGHGVAVSAGQRQFRQTIREAWEAQWLQEQRLLERVVEHESRRTVTEVPVEMQSSAVAADTFTEASLQSPDARPALRASIAPSEVRLEREDTVRAVTQYVRSSPSVVVTSTFPYGRAAPANVRAFAGSSDEGRPTMQLLPQSVAWSEEDGVAVAMRVRTDASHDGILTQLRQWMKEGGIRLVRLIVNGRAQLDHSHAAMTTHTRRQ